MCISEEKDIKYNTAYISRGELGLSESYTG
jgi:hypothetical protein